MDVNAQSGWLDQLQWNERGLIPVIAQELGTGDVLMLAYMNRESLQRTLETGDAVYYSRSRGRLWHKGEESGHYQRVHEIRLDCDGDTLLVVVEQVGKIACHTGRHSCFFNRLDTGPDGSVHWSVVETPLKAVS